MNGIEFYRELTCRLERGEAVTAWCGWKGKYKGQHFCISGSERMQGLEEAFPGYSGEDFFREEFCTRPEVVVFGGGHVSLALERILKTLDLRLTVVDDREEFASRERFREADRLICVPYDRLDTVDFGPQPYYIIVTRGHEGDELCLRHVLSSGYSYIGMIGSRKKVAAALERLRSEGVKEEVIRDIHAPIGLKIGGNTPGEIAVSIAAELIQVKNEKPGMNFSQEIMDALKREKGPMIMAAVLQKTGSSPGKPGSRMLVTEGGRTYGTIGGGSVEYAVLQEARRRLGEEIFQIQEYNLSNEGAASLGMICGGTITVLLESLEGGRS